MMVTSAKRGKGTKMANGKDGKVSIPQGRTLPDGRVSYKESDRAKPLGGGTKK